MVSSSCSAVLTEYGIIFATFYNQIQLRVQLAKIFGSVRGTVLGFHEEDNLAIKIRDLFCNVELARKL